MRGVVFNLTKWSLSALFSFCSILIDSPIRRFIMSKLILSFIQIIALSTLFAFSSFSYAYCDDGTTTKITLNNNSSANTGHLQLYDHTADDTKLCSAGDQSKCSAQACEGNKMRVKSSKYSGYSDFTASSDCTADCTNDGDGTVCMNFNC
jgi:hypothetical protein